MLGAGKSGRNICFSDGDGNLFELGRAGTARKLGRVDLQPVTCLSATHDGRIIGFCGHGIANLFMCDPGKKTIRNLGVALSVINRRRYGYEFSSAVAGKDGEIYFGENDRGGHLWVYYPAILDEGMLP